MSDYETAAHVLFYLLDDIAALDGTSSIDERSFLDDHEFRKNVRAILQERFKVAKIDGLSLTFK
jgi:hypothetical protein